MARFSLLNRIGRRPRRDTPQQPASVFRRAPSPGALRRERRVILKAREERIRDLGGLTLEMYRHSTFRDELLIERCREIVALEERLHELDAMLAAVATARRAPTTCECGAPQPWGSHFCANCGRPVGAEPVVACESCGHPLPADAKFCASCGHPAADEEEQEPEAEDESDEEEVAAVAASEEPEPAVDPWER
ncbi:MAG: zinc ribbon domain-containing protein [Actinobacteria bacterium]|nr:MAG: zinc ribbon domain-containing protein [Actinomycetota bacterium]